MNWWRKLKKNPLARFGAVLLLVFYLAAIAADFVAPYDPYFQQTNGSLLPPTKIYWKTEAGEWIGPHVYPTTQGAIDLETGERELIENKDQPSPIRLFVKGSPYKIFGLIPANLHLFGTTGEGTINLLGTDEQARDQFSRLIHGARISLFIGLVGISISFPLGMIVGGISGYFGGIADTIIMRLLEVMMTIPSIYLLVALAAVLPRNQ